ncbi:MAG: hypothetical protein V4521_05130, partial [Pseudomonadota bacterium]
FAANLSGLTDGTITSSLAITDAAGNTANVSGNAVALDKTADGTPTATLVVNDTADHVVNGSEVSTVAFTVAGLWSFATALEPRTYGATVGVKF